MGDHARERARVIDVDGLEIFFDPDELIGGGDQRRRKSVRRERGSDDLVLQREYRIAIAGEHFDVAVGRDRAGAFAGEGSG